MLRLLLIIAVSAASFVSSPQAARAEMELPPELAGAPVAAVRTDLPLWRVTRGAATVYLLGSVHLLSPDAYPLDPAFYEAFDAATIAGFELDLSEAEAAAPRLLARGVYADGRSLQDVLPQQTYDELRSRASTIGLPALVLESMKPWMAGLTLSAFAMQAAGYAPEWGIDRHFYDRARERGIEVLALETVDQQVEVFDGMSVAGQVAFLESTLRDTGNPRERIDEVAGYWRSGDMDGLARFLTESLEGQPELEERILHARNEAWADRIEDLLRGEDTAIVIVGLAHMTGDRGLPELLRRRGYEVEQVPARS